MWTEKSDFYQQFLNKKAEAEGSQRVAQDLWATWRDLLTFTIVYIHISKERSGGREF